MSRDRQITFFCVTIFLLPWILFISHVASHITSGDSSELALAGVTLGVPHSQGYPAFALLNKILGQLFLFGNEAYRQNLASLFFFCGALVFVGLILIQTTGKPWMSLLSLLFLLSPLFQHQALVTEVFPLTLFFAAFLFYATLKFVHHPRGLILLSFLFGVGVSIHQTLVLLYPGLVFFYFKTQHRPLKEQWKEIGASFVSLGLGLSLHLFILIRAQAQPVLSWEDPQTWDRFWGVITRARYGFLQLSQGETTRALDWASIGPVLWFLKDKFIESFGWVGLGLLFFSTLRSLAAVSSRRLMVACWLMILLSGPFFFWMAEVGKAGGTASVYDRFVLLPLLGSLVLMSFGFWLIWKSKIPFYRFVGLVVVGLLVFERASSSSHFASLDRSLRWDLSLREVGLNTLRHLPRDSYLLADRADEMEFSVGYLKAAENRRPDVRFIDCNAGVTRSAYGNDYYSIWGAPRLRRREKVEGDLIQTTTRPVFYATVDPTMVNLYRAPWGSLYRAWPLNRIGETKPIPWHEILLWRFEPQEERSVLLMRSQIDLLARAQFDTKQKDAVRDLFGLTQKWGGPHRDEQLGYLYQVRRRSKQAYQAYRRAFEAGAASPALFSNLGLLEAQRGLLGPSLQVFEVGLKKYPNSISLLYNASTIYWRQRDWKKVTTLLKRVLELDPRNEEALKQYPKALAYYRFTENQNKKKEPSPDLIP